MLYEVITIVFNVSNSGFNASLVALEVDDAVQTLNTTATTVV